MWIDHQILEKADQLHELNVWIPSSRMIVLGSSNDPKRECFVDICQKDNIPILKRKGGGGTVLLHSGSLVVSYGTWVKDYYENKRYFCLLNKGIVEVLSQTLGPQRFGQKGLSDITLDERKIGGTSLFRSRNYLLYQASLLIETHMDWIETYLRHPSKEPDYRKGKSHREFLVGLSEVFPHVSIHMWQQIFSSRLLSVYQNLLKEDYLDSPPEDQAVHVKKSLK